MSDAKKLIKAPDVNKSKFINIDHIWAENGVVNVRLKDGTLRLKKVSKAAQEAYILNKVLKRARIHHPYLVPHHEELLETYVRVIKEAKAQIENGDKGATYMQRVMKGQAPDGTPIADAVSEDENIEYLKNRYPLVEEHEIATVLREDDLTFQNKERMIAAVNNQRIQKVAVA